MVSSMTCPWLYDGMTTFTLVILLPLPSYTSPARLEIKHRYCLATVMLPLSCVTFRHHSTNGDAWAL